MSESEIFECAPLILFRVDEGRVQIHGLGPFQHPLQEGRLKARIPEQLEPIVFVHQEGRQDMCTAHKTRIRDGSFALRMRLNLESGFSY